MCAMKKNLLIAGALTTVLVLGLGLAVVNNNKQPENIVLAEQHIDNYDPYTYSGDYYSGIDVSTLTEGLNGTLRTNLTTLIHPTQWYSYSNSGENTLSYRLQYADEDPTDSSKMVYLYTRDSVKKNAASSWNREHVWPQSLSGPTSSQKNWGEGQAGTDLLHIRPTYNNTNSDRSNDIYADTNKANPKTYNGMVYGYETGERFEPLDSVKGDVARIIMYIWVAYKNHYSTLPDVTKVFENYDTLLKWHTNDAPDVLEGNRNDYVESTKQKNRNPFVDHPEYAWMVFGDSASASVKQECMEAYPADGSPAKILESISISGEATKKNYVAGDTFDPTGLTVTAHYDDTSTKDIPVGSCTWTPKSLTAGITSVTCTYNGKTATYSGITVTPPHEHTYSDEYTSDATFHWHAATCGHDVVSGKERHSFEDTVIPPTAETGGYTTHTCKVCGYTYRDGETQPLSLVRIRVTDNKADTGYQIGEELDITVTAEYNDNSKAVVTDYTVEGFNNRKSGEQIITVMYTAGTVTKGAIITVNVLSNGEEDPDPEQPEQPDDKEKRGCSGSITASLSITAFSALIGLVFIFKRRK